MDERLCTHLDMVWLVDENKHEGLEFPNTIVPQNLLLNFMGTLLHDSVILLWEFIHTAGNPFSMHLPEITLVNYAGHGLWEREEHLGVGVIGAVPVWDTMEEGEQGSHGNLDQVDLEMSSD